MSETPKKLKIVRIIARLNIGGPAIHVTLLTEKLRQPPYDYECALVVGPVPKTEGDMTYFAESRGVEPIIVPELGRSIHPLRDLVTVWKLVRLLRQHKPDIVHTHTMKAGFVGRIAARLAGVPVIFHTAHGLSFQGYWGKRVTQLFINLERIAAWSGDRLVTLTESLRDELVNVYHVSRAEKTVVLPLGLDLGRFAETPRRAGTFRASYSIPDDAPLVAVVGRLVPIKNHDLFLRAALRLHEMRPDARLMIIGDGELREGLEAQVDALGLRQSVIFTGWIKDLAPVYSDLDAVVISSLNEGTPVSLIEAMAAGCPVVSTAVGGVPDLLKGGQLGLLVPSRDETALADAMLRVIEHPPDTEETRQTILARYHIDRLVRELHDLYQEVWKAKRKTLGK